MTRNVLCFVRTAVLGACALMSCSGIVGQTESQLEKRYSRPVVFEIRPGINAFPAFAPDGNVCRLVIAKRPTVDNRSADMDITMSPILVKEIEDEVVPPPARGPELSGFLSPESYVAGGAWLIQKDYDNVSIGASGNSVDTYAIIITWRHHLCSK